jgi:hypothetical protein
MKAVIWVRFENNIYGELRLAIDGLNSCEIDGFRGFVFSEKVLTHVIVFGF